MATKKQRTLKKSTRLQEVQLPPGYVMVPQVAPQGVISPSATPSGKLHVSDQLVALIFMLVLAGLLLTNEFNLISFFDVSQGAPSEAPVYVSPSHFGRESACQPPLICPDNTQTEVFSNQAVVPVVPQAQIVPVAPQVPAVPVAPEVPAAPVAPEVPAAPEVPEVPAAPEATAIPQAPAAPQGSSQPTAPEAATQQEETLSQPTAQAEPQAAPLENQATDNPNPSESAAPAEGGGSDACHPPMVCDPSVPAAPVATPIPEQAAPPIEIPEKPSVLVPSEVNGYVSPSDFGQQASQCHPPQICRADE